MRTYPLLIPVLALLLFSAGLAAAVPRTSPLDAAQGIEAQRASGPHDPAPRACAFVCDVPRDARFF